MLELACCAFENSIPYQDTWANAWFQCRQAQNGVLAAIENVSEDRYIEAWLIANGLTTAWIRVTYEARAWIWGATGRAIGAAGYTNWDPDDPGSTSYNVHVFLSGIMTSMANYDSEFVVALHLLVCINFAYIFANFRICDQRIANFHE